MDWLENQISRFFQIWFSGNAVCVVWLVLVGSHSSKLRINHRLSCWIPDFVRKVLDFFESLYQPSGPVGKTKPAGSFGSVC